jgi:hypothetical protein
MYNGGPHPNAAARAYGSSLGGVAQGIVGSLDVTVTHKDGHGHTTSRERHNVPVRQAKGAKKLH